MKLLRLAGLLLALGAALAPELSLYTAERRLFRASALARLAATSSPGRIPAGRLLADAADEAERIAETARFDVRPLVLAAGARLLRGEAERALGFYVRATRLGERLDVDWHAARALDLLGRGAEAHQARLRVAWRHPFLFSLSPPPEGVALDGELRRLAASRPGRFAPPPSLPPSLGE